MFSPSPPSPPPPSQASRAAHRIASHRITSPNTPPRSLSHFHQTHHARTNTHHPVSVRGYPHRSVRGLPRRRPRPLLRPRRRVQDRPGLPRRLPPHAPRPPAARAPLGHQPAQLRGARDKHNARMSRAVPIPRRRSRAYSAFGNLPALWALRRVWSSEAPRARPRRKAHSGLSGVGEPAR